MVVFKCGHPKTEANTALVSRPARLGRQSRRERACRTCRRKQGREYAKRTYPQRRPREVSRQRLKSTGWTPEQYAAAFRAQGGLCAICEKSSEQQALAADHDHTKPLGAGQRALLCIPCNLMIGNSGEDPARLARAAEYLVNYGG